MNINLEKFITGPLENNTYLILDESKNGLLFDPSSPCDSLIKHLHTEKINLQAILLTHGHFDHILGIPDILEQFPNCPVYVHPLEKEFLLDPTKNGSFLIGSKFIYDGPTIDITEGKLDIGKFHLDVRIIPGHSSAGTAFIIDQYCLCGDILFAGSIGRTDLYGGDQDALTQGIREKLFVLPDSMIVCPGHGGRTSIGREKKLNPFFS